MGTLEKKTLLVVVLWKLKLEVVLLHCVFLPNICLFSPSIFFFFFIIYLKYR